MRKTICFAALILLLTAGLAFAGSEPVAVPTASTEATSSAVQTAPAASPVLFDLQPILGGESCAPAPQPTSVKPGCSRTCKVDRDCPYYPEQVCGGGCCVF
ncbi:MAG: hypothetical protein ACJ75H_11310 [Thermoanaerobaculia bacterium]